MEVFEELPGSRHHYLLARWEYGRVREDRRYYLASLGLEPAGFSEAVRARWGVENKIHWRLDVTFGEDQSRAGTKYASANLSALSQMAINIARLEPGKKGLAREMRSAIANPDFILTLFGPNFRCVSPGGRGIFSLTARGFSDKIRTLPIMSGRSA